MQKGYGPIFLSMVENTAVSMYGSMLLYKFRYGRIKYLEKIWLRVILIVESLARSRKLL
jgi:hypothetical protein